MPLSYMRRSGRSLLYEEVAALRHGGKRVGGAAFTQRALLEEVSVRRGLRGDVKGLSS